MRALSADGLTGSARVKRQAYVGWHSSSRDTCGGNASSDGSGKTSAAKSWRRETEAA